MVAPIIVHSLPAFAHSFLLPSSSSPSPSRLLHSTARHQRAGAWCFGKLNFGALLLPEPAYLPSLARARVCISARLIPPGHPPYPLLAPPGPLFSLPVPVGSFYSIFFLQERFNRLFQFFLTPFEGIGPKQKDTTILNIESGLGSSREFGPGRGPTIVDQFGLGSGNVIGTQMRQSGIRNQIANIHLRLVYYGINT